MSILKIAFRNIFRNKKRSLFTIIAFIIAISGIIFGLSYMTGLQEMIMQEGINITGHIRITSPDFDLKEKQLDISSNIPYEDIKNKINKSKEILKNIKYITSRTKFGSLVYKDDKDEKALGFGIEETDYDILNFSKYIINGRFLNFNNNSEIIIGSKISKKLNISLGDEVTLLTSTQYNSVSAFNYIVVGIYNMDNSRLNQSFYITHKDAEYLLDMDNYSTEILIFFNNYKKLSSNLKIIKNIFQNDNYMIKPWYKIGLNEYSAKSLPVIKFYFMLIFSILAGVSISNTMIMIVFERRKEIGILRSMGMKDFLIQYLLILEGLILGTIGTVIGIIIGGGIGYYYSINGIYFGKVLEVLSGEYNLGTTVYTTINIQIILTGILLGIISSIFSTYIAIQAELRKKTIENLRN